MFVSDSMGPGLQLVGARFSTTRVHTSPNVDISRHSNGHISAVRDTAVRWLRMLVELQIL